ncbi:MAG: phospholipid carrier-dependent glycosyltransferase [Candidatus Nanopelagicaceae bacterium]|nr:phospholipid carrier-dependent glycosyltransferase [Candidatus Nanopelagicaceae bacterium]
MKRPHFLALLSILLFSALTRFINLGRPPELVFDEVYYVDGARDYLAHGVELDKGAAEFIVHPPIGKWLIAFGIKVFGDNPFGWRFTAALIGTVSIMLVYLIAKQLFKAEFISLVTAALMALDGLHLVMSRTALLDIFLSFFILLAFYLLIKEKLWWAGVVFGLALGTKWSAIYVLAAVGIYLLIAQRRFLLTPIQFGLLPLVVYISSWFGWFLNSDGWSRNSKGNTLASLINYHREILNFHTGLTTDHSYQASAWNWLILGRPTSFFYDDPKSCGAESCSQEVLAIGTPILWWAGLVAIFVAMGYFLYRREKSNGLILLFLLSSYLPWLAFPERTTFFFYAIAFQPFLILCIGFVLNKFLENEATRKLRQQYTLAGVAVVALCFAYFFPVFVGQIINYSDWYARMWFSSWI